VPEPSLIVYCGAVVSFLSKTGVVNGLLRYPLLPLPQKAGFPASPRTPPLPLLPAKKIFFHQPSVLLMHTFQQPLPFHPDKRPSRFFSLSPPRLLFSRICLEVFLFF